MCIGVVNPFAIWQIGVGMCGQGDECLQVVADDFGGNVLDYGLLGQSGDEARATGACRRALSLVSEMPHTSQRQPRARASAAAPSSAEHNSLACALACPLAQGVARATDIVDTVNTTNAESKIRPEFANFPHRNAQSLFRNTRPFG